MGQRAPPVSSMVNGPREIPAPALHKTCGLGKPPDTPECFIYDLGITMLLSLDLLGELHKVRAVRTPGTEQALLLPPPPLPCIS